MTVPMAVAEATVMLPNAAEVPPMGTTPPGGAAMTAVSW